jgi:hypothetical protein
VIAAHHGGEASLVAALAGLVPVLSLVAAAQLRTMRARLRRRLAHARTMARWRR